jgi:hypothetical protein
MMKPKLIPITTITVKTKPSRLKPIAQFNPSPTTAI